MKSITLYTEEIDDIEIGINDMLGQLDDFTFQKNSIGILFVPTEMDLAFLTAQLKEKLHIPIMGATGTAIFSDKCSYQINSMTLQILTADDCSFAAGITATITEDNVEQELGGLCQRLQAELPGPAKVGISYITTLNNRIGMNYIKYLTQYLPGIPVYGGTAAEDFNCDNGQIFFRTEIRGCGVILLLISGEVRPIIRCEYSISQEIPIPGEAVCKDGFVERIGEKNFIQALQEIGVSSEHEYVLPEFTGIPFVTQQPMENGDTISIVRLLKTLDHDKNRGSFLGGVRNGTRFSVGLLERSKIKQSVENLFKQLIAEMEAAEGYQYSTIICTSCAAREMAMSGDVSDEGDVFLPLLPGNVSLNGMYSFGEICPVKGKSGQAYNAYHTTSFTVLAM